MVRGHPEPGFEEKTIMRWLKNLFRFREKSDDGLVKPFLDAMQKSEWIVANFTTNWRPLFNETAAKALTADPKTADNAKRLFMDDPEKALSMTLKGPAQDQQAYTEAFNKVFGA